MRQVLPLIILLFSFPLFSQVKEKVPPTDAIVVSGLVEKEITFGIAEISAITSRPVADVVITNHVGEPRGTAKGLRGVLVKDLLSGVTIKSESPKVLSEFYFTFIASDGYTVVYSWNELFNSPNGENCYLIVEKDGKKLFEMPERMLVITPTDFKTGRRHIKGLSRISVARASKN
ncbi:MAG: hypothetical protein JNL40_10735 [Cyclobacteriaceae bacterium]|nr:hypothetical protein [Cyclobacteriaceae bacterium]